ncbi:MAG: cytochrome C oxidase subunit IV family protein [Blastocatellia bacterium]
MSTHSGHSGHHISPISQYVIIWLALMALTIITVGVAQLDFGPLNTVVAMTVATIKAGLVVLFFMHLKYDKPFHSVAFGIGIVFFGLFLGLMLLDVGARTDPEPSRNFAVIPTPTPYIGKPHGSGGHGAAAASEHKEEAKPAAAGEHKEEAKPAGEHK